MNFLQKVLEAKRREIERLREDPPAPGRGAMRGFARAISVPGLSVIAEIKRASPSKGVLVPGLDVPKTAKAYAAGGAAAVSCLTDRDFFGALARDFAQARATALPVLRKDFIIDELQIDESAAMGASAILLIVRILETERLAHLSRHAAASGLDVLVEVHDESEIDRALSTGASIIGVNNRNLDTLVVDPDRALKLRPRIPSGVSSVAESGVRTREDVKRIEGAGFDAVLIGETLATSPDPEATLRELLGQAAGVSR